jgi:hypothetical protein
LLWFEYYTTSSTANRTEDIEYLHWLLTSKLGHTEIKTTNNHHTWLAVETMALALSTNASATAEYTASQMMNVTMPGSLSNQIRPDGQMPNETKREDSISYDCMNVRGLLNLVQVGQHSGAGKRFWEYSMASQ